MKALIKSKPEKGLWLENIAIPKVEINDVLMKIFETSICGTDLHIWNSDQWAQNNIPAGTTIGHEFVGVIQNVGSNVHDYKKGDFVSGEEYMSSLSVLLPNETS